ncbi:MAG: type III secretion system stalk subunit SctO [Desulfovibrionaceae bacterium]
MVEKYPLDILIRARKSREDRAQMELISAKGLVESIELSIVRIKEEIVDYEKWRIEEEKRLFTEIKNKALSQKELDSFKRSILVLKARHIEMEEEIAHLDNELEQAKESVLNKEGFYKEAINKKQKIEGHKELWTEEYKKELARLEDLELEEFTGKKISGFEDIKKEE